MRDLIVLASCSQTRCAMRGILSRHESLGIHPVDAQIITHPNLDPGCLNTSHEMLRSQQQLFKNALVVFDREGCGQERRASTQLSQDVLRMLERNGWAGRAAVVVIDPELEAWVWSPSPEVDIALGWGGQIPGLRTWLGDAKWIDQGEMVPGRPKEAMLAALRESNKKHSGAIMELIASRVSFANCGDKNFLRLRKILRRWFGSAQPDVFS